MEKIVKYLIEFLLREENLNLNEHVVYGMPIDNAAMNKVYICPSGFFESSQYMTEDSMPELPLRYCEGVPVLYGGDKIHNNGNYIIMEPDIIASTFFMVSRYEEYVRRNVRDSDGRFIGHQSVAYKCGFLDRPIVEDYAKILRDCLRKVGLEVKEPVSRFSHIYMTHDIDIPWTYQNSTYDTMKVVLKDIIAIIVGRNRQLRWERLKTLAHIQKDPVDNFSWLLSKDSEVKEIYGNKFTDLYFLMTCPPGKKDMGYINNTYRTKVLLDKLKSRRARMGLHISYRAGEDPKYVIDEQNVYEKVMGEKATCSRHHCLSCREPEDMYELLNAGIKDDFSLCYADGGGYRLGTCRPVRWIDPAKKVITELTLHPLLATEGKLCGSQYMGMTPGEAVLWFKRQFLRICKENGELVILFHNSSFTSLAPYPYEKIYTEIIDILKENKFYDTYSNM